MAKEGQVSNFRSLVQNIGAEKKIISMLGQFTDSLKKSTATAQQIVPLALPLLSRPNDSLCKAVLDFLKSYVEAVSSTEHIVTLSILQELMLFELWKNPSFAAPPVSKANKLAASEIRKILYGRIGVNSELPTLQILILELDKIFPDKVARIKKLPKFLDETYRLTKDFEIQRGICELGQKLYQQAPFAYKADLVHFVHLGRYYKSYTGSDKIREKKVSKAEWVQPSASEAACASIPIRDSGINMSIKRFQSRSIMNLDSVVRDVVSASDPIQQSPVLQEDATCKIDNSEETQPTAVAAVPLVGSGHREEPTLPAWQFKMLEGDDILAVAAGYSAQKEAFSEDLDKTHKEQLDLEGLSEDLVRQEQEILARSKKRAAESAKAEKVLFGFNKFFEQLVGDEVIKDIKVGKIQIDAQVHESLVHIYSRNPIINEMEEPISSAPLNESDKAELERYKALTNVELVQELGILITREAEHSHTCTKEKVNPFSQNQIDLTLGLSCKKYELIFLLAERSKAIIRDWEYTNPETGYFTQVPNATGDDVSLLDLLGDFHPDN